MSTFFISTVINFAIIGVLFVIWTLLWLRGGLMNSGPSMAHKKVTAMAVTGVLGVISFFVDGWAAVAGPIVGMLGIMLIIYIGSPSFFHDPRARK
ncbi:MAG: hypothetical protein IT342_21860 [Candidatus Melainabacteria bacterium]|nr:hypothetical protein [Candidatus Melainabacteria bacterium]